MRGYSEQFMSCFLNPQGIEKLKDFDCSSELDVPEDGMYVVFYTKKTNDFISISYNVEGCPTSIAVCCVLYYLYNKKTIDITKMLL